MSKNGVYKYAATIARTAPRRVNFFNYESDFQCPLLAAMGLSTAAIADRTGLTEGQVMYRIMKFEDAVRRKGEATSRSKYRHGKGDVAEALIQQVTGVRSPVKSLIIGRMEKKDLYTPRPKGVLLDQR